ncbi:hypothetical protein DFP93_1137 [Aneurinibacillus soli]|uniref:Uncharacterized protein n=1 Tax=Aneurinibacillus soli TaxID=1500254 RepID=A0A0U5AZ60_9BACL|nr:hypothetical protein [Aneurinibacillus soli]PYE60304.1 hypothetical protein DFP93_1137 [Aneurinibacillus soli]BAU27296.1 hypothetical protein CB4_01470 [Aneurinibacillus soli]
MSGNRNPLPPVQQSDPMQYTGPEFLYALARQAEQDGDIERAELYYRRALDLALLMRQPGDANARHTAQQKKAAFAEAARRPKRRFWHVVRSQHLFLYLNIIMILYMLVVIIFELTIL